MGGDHPESHDKDEELPPEITIPQHAPLPQPPDIQFTRPTLSQRGAGSPGRSSGGGEPERKREPVSGEVLGQGLAVSISFAASIVAGFLIGQWIDHHLFHGGQMWGTLVMSVAGFVAGFYNVVRLTAGWDKKRK